MKGLRMQRPSRFGLALGAVLAALSFPAAAQEVVLKGVAAFQEGSIYAQKFEQYIKAVNEKGKGQIRIQYLGGAPKVMPLFDVGKNLKDGVIDIVTTSSAYYGNVLPEAEAMKLIEVSMAELRSNGGLAFLNKLHVDKANTAVPGPPLQLRAGAHLPQQGDHQARLLGTEDPRHPDVPADGGEARRHRHQLDPARSLHHARAQHGRWLRLGDARHLRLLLAEGDEVPCRSGVLSPRHHAAGEPRHLDQEAERRAAQAAARSGARDRGQHRRRRR